MGGDAVERRRRRRELTYTDELLADGSVHRRYADGREEWRDLTPSGTVRWRDNRGRSGTDEALGGLVRRAYDDGRVVYGREVGYGRTLWGDGVLTVNHSSGGRLGALLSATSHGVRIGRVPPPPRSLTEEEERELRRQTRTRKEADRARRGETETTVYVGYGSWGGDGDDGDDDFG
jgi:hypothetical protein